MKVDYEGYNEIIHFQSESQPRHRFQRGKPSAWAPWSVPPEPLVCIVIPQIDRNTPFPIHFEWGSTNFYLYECISFSKYSKSPFLGRSDIRLCQCGAINTTFFPGSTPIERRIHQRLSPASHWTPASNCVCFFRRTEFIKVRFSGREMALAVALRFVSGKTSRCSGWDAGEHVRTPTFPDAGVDQVSQDLETYTWNIGKTGIFSQSNHRFLVENVRFEIQALNRSG